MGTQVEHEHRAPRPPACGNSAYYPHLHAWISRRVRLIYHACFGARYNRRPAPLIDSARPRLSYRWAVSRCRRHRSAQCRAS